MMLTMSASVKRLTDDGNGHKTYQIAGSYPCLIQPVSKTAIQEGNMIFASSYVCHFSHDADIQTSDKLTIGNDTYTVSGMRSFDYSRLKHKIAEVRKEA